MNEQTSAGDAGDVPPAADGGAATRPGDERVNLVIVFRKKTSGADAATATRIAGTDPARNDAAAPAPMVGKAKAEAENPSAPAASAAAEDARPIADSEILVVSVTAADAADADVRNVRVAEDGSIEVPSAGRVKVIGLTTQQVETAVRQRWGERTADVAPGTQIRISRPGEEAPAAAAPADAEAPADTAAPADAPPAEAEPPPTEAPRETSPADTSAPDARSEDVHIPDDPRRDAADAPDAGTPDGGTPDAGAPEPEATPPAPPGVDQRVDESAAPPPGDAAAQ